MPRTKLIYFIFLLGLFNFAHSQKGKPLQEIGVMTGPVFFQSDFGARNEFKNYYKNNGFSFGIFYYLSALNNSSALSEKVKLRIEASYMTTNLNHYGKYVDNNNNSLFTQQLRAMRGTVETLNAGLQLEYYPWKTDDYNRGYSFSPYISVGAQISNYTSTITSTLGEFGSPTVTPVKYLDGFKNESDIVGSLTTSIGARYLLNDYNALVIDARIQYYFSDWVDGLNPNKNIYTENKSNDWSTTINFGYVYYFN